MSDHKKAPAAKESPEYFEDADENVQTKIDSVIPGEFASKENDALALLKDKISFLEEALVAKDKEIANLKKENLILFKTAVKHSEEKAEAAAKKSSHASGHVSD